MTLNVNDVRDEYTATSSQTIFNYTFKIYASTDLDVYVTPAGLDCTDGDLTTAYTVAGVGAEAGGSITLTTPSTVNDLVTIISSIPSSRTTDYQNNGDFRPDTVNDDFDRTVSLVKQAIDKSNRALTFLDCEQGVTSLTLPPPSANNFLRWKSDLTGMENFTFSTTGIVAEVSVDDYPALRGLTSSAYTDGQVIFVTDDGIGGEFIVKTATVTDNAGTLIVFTDDSNRYAERLFDGPVSVKWFEAVGDGVANDTTEIQACFDYAKTLTQGATVVYPSGKYLHSDINYNSTLAGIRIVANGLVELNAVSGTTAMYWFGYTATDTLAVTDTVVNFDGMFRFDGLGNAARAIQLHRTRFNPTTGNCLFTGFTGSIIRTAMAADTGTPSASNVVNLDCSNLVFLTSGIGNVGVESGNDTQVLNLRNCYFRNDDANPAEFVISEKTANLKISSVQMLRAPQSAVSYTSAKAFMKLTFGLGVMDIGDNCSFVASHPTLSDLPSYIEVDMTGAAGTSAAVMRFDGAHFLDEGAHFHSSGYIHFVSGGARSASFNNLTFDTTYNYSSDSGANALHAPPIHFDNNFDMLFKTISIKNLQWVTTGATSEADLLTIKGGGGTNFRFERVDMDVNKQIRYQGSFTAAGDTDLTALLTKRSSGLLSSKFGDTHRKFRYDLSEDDTWIEVFNVVFGTASTSYVGCEFNVLMAAEAGGVQFYKKLYQLQGNTGAATATDKGELGTVPGGDGGDGTLPATSTDNIWWFEEDASNETVTFYVKKDDVTDVLEVEMSLLQVSNRTQAAGVVITWNPALEFEY